MDGMNDEVHERIVTNVALVEHIVTRMSARFPGHVDRDDLVQAGMVALVETAGRYDPDRGIAFSTFAGRRIEGAILDVVRREDWLPRSVRAKARQVDAVEQQLIEQRGETPDRHTLAEALDLTVGELTELQGKVRRGVVIALDRVAGESRATVGDLVADEADDPVAGIEAEELRAYLRSAIHLLPPRHRVVVIGYFLEGRPMDELGALLGVTQSRISQIKDDAVARIREGLQAQYAETPPDPAPRRRDRARQEYAAAIAEHSATREPLAAV